MKVVILFFLFFPISLKAQTNTSVQFKSQILNENRTIQIHLPKSYNDSVNLKYPVVYTLDGDYLFSETYSIIDYYSYWSKSPECIVVSIHQNYTDTVKKEFIRWLDCSYSWNTGFPKSKGILFKDFINKELIPHIDKTYRTTHFRGIVGHSFTANFINYFLFDSISNFDAYISISPYYAKKSLDSLKLVLNTINQPIFYFVAVGQNDLSGHIKSVKEFDKKFSKIKNTNFKYKFYKENTDATHSSIVPKSLPYAIDHIFSIFTSINTKSKYKAVKKSKNSLNYLLNKYKSIENIYGINIKIRLEDIEIVSDLIINKNEWNDLKTLADISFKLYPNEYIGYWIMAEYEAHNKNYRSSLLYYNEGIEMLKKSGCSNIEDFMKDVDRVKKKVK